MRKIPIAMLTPDMELARAISNGSQILINAGVKDLGRYIRRLEEMGISYVYIEDAAGEGIEIDELITTKTRMHCKRSMANNFSRMQNNLSIDMKETTDVAQNLFEEILSHDDVLYDLNEIGSIGDNTLDHSINTTIYAICLAIQMKYDTSKTIATCNGNLVA